MSADLDPADTSEVRRRVVEPVVRSFIGADELEGVEVRAEMRRPAFYEAAESILLAKITARGEQLEVYLGTLSDEPWDAVETAAFLYDQIESEISETAFAWGEQRGGDYSVPPAATDT